jgi:hypothetical protein
MDRFFPSWCRPILVKRLTLMLPKNFGIRVILLTIDVSGSSVLKVGHLKNLKHSDEKYFDSAFIGLLFTCKLYEYDECSR